MTLAFITYFEANLVVNIIILCFLAAFILSRNTTLFVTLFGLMILPIVFPVPTNYGTMFRDNQLSKLAEKFDKMDEESSLEHYETHNNTSTSSVKEPVADDAKEDLTENKANLVSKSKDTLIKSELRKIADKLGVENADELTEQIANTSEITIGDQSINIEALYTGSAGERMAAIADLYSGIDLLDGMDKTQLNSVKEVLSTNVTENSWYGKSLKDYDTQIEDQQQSGGIIETINTVTSPKRKTLKIPKGSRASVGGVVSKKITFGGSFLKAFEDPEAMWFFIRMFWLAGAAYIFIQRQAFGIGLFAMNLFPFAYMTRLLPFIFYVSEENPWTRVGNHLIEKPELILLVVKQFNMSVIQVGFMIILTVLSLFLFFKMLARTQRGKLADFLDPNTYYISMYGKIRDFEIINNELWVDGIRLDLTRMNYDAENKRKWYMDSGTVIEFIPKEYPTENIS
ncbi:MAG: hypothetical protein AAF984_05710 [Verrucomicrobiota bacterium]